MRWASAEITIRSTLTVCHQDQPGYHHCGNRDQLGQHTERQIYQWLSLAHMTTHVHTHTYTAMLKHTVTCAQTHSIFPNILTLFNYGIIFSFIKIRTPSKYLNVPNYRYSEIYWISQSNSEYMTLSQCDISSYSIDCFSTQIQASIAVCLKAYILCLMLHSHPTIRTSNKLKLPIQFGLSFSSNPTLFHSF